MSQETVPPAPQAATDPPQQEAEQSEEEQPDAPERQRQEAWAARRALIQHGPPVVMSLDRTGSASRIGRDQYGMSGGTVHGDLNFFAAPAAPTEHLSGAFTSGEMTELAEVFCGCPSFDEALTRLRTDRVVILAGGRDTGRKAAAQMLLHRVAGSTVRRLGPPRSLAALVDQLDQADGYLLADLTVDRGNSVREPHLLGLRERLKRAGGHLVITVEPSAALDDVHFVRWEPPLAEQILAAHVTPRTGDEAWQSLRGLEQVREFLTGRRRPTAIKEFATRLVAVHQGKAEVQTLADFTESTLDALVSHWLANDQSLLADQSFLISLAVFDKAPYAVTAELSDVLHALLQRTADPRVPPIIPVFGVSRENRLQQAHARGYHGVEVTDWGVVGQFIAEFSDERTAQTLLTTVWNLHPSARPALVKWISRLAKDGRPLVRTRAAAAAALLSTADFSTAVAHLIEPWADAKDPGSWLTAANALTLAHLMGLETVLPLLRDWCTEQDASRRWTAIRAYGLLGPVVPEETLNVLLDAVRRQPHPDQADGTVDVAESSRQLSDALELLLLAVRGPVLSRLAACLGQERAVSDHALVAFLHACKQSEEPDDRPLALHWYAEALATDDVVVAGHLVAFWGALLADRVCGPGALETLAGWIRREDDRPEFEAALLSLLLAVTAAHPNDRRVHHLLSRLRDSQVSPSAAAARLLDRLPRL